jgi:hypothetical protein
MTATVPLTKGLQALVDDEDLELVLAAGPWCADKISHTIYAVHSRYNLGRVRQVLMHRLIMDAAPGQQIDHVNRDGLDNRRANLRFCTASQNRGNQAKFRGVSQYKGVVWDRSRNLWSARIGHQGRTLYLGRFVSEEDAARAYDKAACEKWGEFARLNFPLDAPSGLC